MSHTCAPFSFLRAQPLHTTAGPLLFLSQGQFQLSSSLLRLRFTASRWDLFSIRSSELSKDPQVLAWLLQSAKLSFPSQLCWWQYKKSWDPFVLSPPRKNTCAPQQLQLFWVAKISRAKQEEQLCSQLRNGSETSNTDSLSHAAGKLLLHLLKPLIASQKPISPAAPHLRGLEVVAGATVSPFDEKKPSHYPTCSNRLLALT